ncbi:MAG: stalk domain-containing protein, partial [Abditibacteriales bacterium]|nr:stalk domain-containing protein [Abditibacteriales bacterium]
MSRFTFLLLCLLFASPTLWAQQTTTMTLVCQPPVVERDGAVLLPLNFLQEALGMSLSTHNGAQRLRYYHVTVDFQVGQTKALVNDRETPLAVAPIAVDSQIYVPASLLTEAFGLQVDVARRYEDRTSLNVSGRSGVITHVRHSVAPDKVRLVIDLDAPALFSVHRFVRAVTVDLAATAAPQLLLPGVLPVSDVLVSQVDFLSGAPGHTFISSTYRYRAPAVVFTLAEPYRVIIDCQKIFEERWEQSIAPGITYRQMRRGTSDGPLMVYLAEVDWHNPHIEVDVAPAGERIMSRQPVSAIAAAENAVVAINGGYFAIPSGAPIGAMMRHREWMRLPSRGRSALGITTDRKIVMDNLNAVGLLTINR